MKNIRINYFFIFFFTLLIFTSCEEDGAVPDEENEMEVITDGLRSSLRINDGVSMGSLFTFDKIGNGRLKIVLNRRRVG